MAKTKRKHGDLSDSAHRVWLAGLGALALAEERGGKLFDTLVGRGRRFEHERRIPVGQAAKRVRGTVESVRHGADRTWKLVESALDERVSAALERLGLPSHRELSHLTRCVEELTNRLEGRAGPAPARRRAATTRRRLAAKKKVARRKVVA